MGLAGQIEEIQGRAENPLQIGVMQGQRLGDGDQQLGTRSGGGATAQRSATESQ